MSRIDVVLRCLGVLVMGCLLGAGHGSAQGEVQEGEMSGYLLVPNERVAEEYGAGFSMYVAAWPLLENYPGRRFQTGLFGTWMHARNDKPLPIERLYSDIEGGLGWWRDTRFATETPKFIMGGVALNFVEWANGPGAGKGRSWEEPRGKYGVAQLSPWVLWPPDGLNLKQGTCGELFGYGYLPLPLTEPKDETAGVAVPTGNQCWTLFLDTGNFKGPVAFFTPYFFSRASVDDPRLAGLFLDTRPSQPNRALQMETQYVPAVQATGPDGATYARVAPTRFPRNADGSSTVVHRVASYRRSALWDAVERWFAGGEVASGAVREEGTVIHRFTGGGGATWRIFTPKQEREDRVPIGWKWFATSAALDPDSFGYRWESPVRAEEGTDPSSEESEALVRLPEYYRLVPPSSAEESRGKPEWVPVTREDVPAETGLREVEFERAERGRPEPYVTPNDPTSCWKTPGPVAGPFEARLGDGSIVTYWWYRFADQPAILNADLSDDEREALQTRVEKLHRHWKKDGTYLAPPTTGTLADLDPALIVSPPSGLEVGYVPIVTRQAAAD